MSGWFLRGPYFWAFPTIFTLGPAFCLWKPVDSRKVNYSFAWENSWWLYICPLLVSSPELMPGRPQKFVYTIQNTKKSTKGPGESVFVKFAVNLCRNGQGYTVTPPENPRCFHLKTKKHFGKETKIWTKPSSFWASKCFSPLGRASHSHYIVFGLSFSPFKTKIATELGSSEAISNNKLPDSAWRTRSIRESFLQVIEVKIFMDYPRRSIYSLVVGHPKRKVVLWSMITIYDCGNIEGIINHCY